MYIYIKLVNNLIVYINSCIYRIHVYTYIFIYIILYVGINMQNKVRVIYPDIPSAIWPVPHNEGIHSP